MIGTAYAAEPAAAGSGIPQFESSHFSSQFFWAVVSFFVLMYLLNKYVIPAIGNVLDARNKQIADDLDNAKLLRQEAEETMASLRQELSHTHITASKILEEAHQDAKQQKVILLAQLDEELAKKREGIVQEIDLAKRKAMTEIRELAVKVSILATEKLIAKTVTEIHANQMVEDVIKQIQNDGIKLH